MGLDWSKLKVRLGVVGRVRCEPGWRLVWGQDPRHKDCDLWFVWAGQGHMWIDESDIDLRPGICIWMRPGRGYIAEQDINDRLGVTFMHFDLLDGRGRPIHDMAHLPSEVHELVDVHYADTVCRRVIDLMRDGRPTPLAERVATQLFTGLLIDIEAGLSLPPTGTGGTPLHHHRMIMQLIAGIHERPREIQTVEQMAHQVGYSPDHFTRVFKAVTGQSPQQYTIAARLNRATQLLGESTLSVGQIADVLGYEDVYFFSRQFKQKIGRTPLQYRQTLRRS